VYLLVSLGHLDPLLQLPRDFLVVVEIWGLFDPVFGLFAVLVVDSVSSVLVVNHHELVAALLAIHRERIVAWLMVASAVGFLASSVMYNAGKIILVPMSDVPHKPRYPTEISDYLRFLYPTPLPLLVGAALALLARRMESEQNSG
jgi:hypothetical protein